MTKVIVEYKGRPAAPPYVGCPEDGCDWHCKSSTIEFAVEAYRRHWKNKHAPQAPAPTIVEAS